MKVILTTDVKKVGRKGELVTVADGYGMNVLVRTGKGIVATAENIKKHEVGESAKAASIASQSERDKALLASIDGKLVPISAPASQTGTLFKALHEVDIATAIKNQLHAPIPESAIKLSAPIKQHGMIPVHIELNDHSAQITLQVK